MGARGELVVCTDWRVDPEFLSAISQQLRREHPEIGVTVRHANPREQIVLLRTGDAQVGFVSREMIGSRSDLGFFRVDSPPVNALVAATHRFAHRRSVRLAELADERWVDCAGMEAREFRRFVLQQCRVCGYTPAVGPVAGSLEELFAIVADGGGISAAPDHVRPPAGLTVVGIPTDCPSGECGAVWNAGQASALTENYLAILRRQRE